MGGEFEDEREQTVTMDEYLEDMEAQELEADLVLGGDEGKECTYSKGYMKRQALFSCITCTPHGNSGICTACSLSCHDGHEVVELWTKRNFRCDCGNSKFGEVGCKLLADKAPENPGNAYNQNFKGIYCICSRPYPDSEAEEQVEMIQCCICEDWFHENHLGLASPEEIPRDEEREPLYEDFICQKCATICSFLEFYPQKIRELVKIDSAQVSSAKEEIPVDNEPSDTTSSAVCSQASQNEHPHNMGYKDTILEDSNEVLPIKQDGASSSAVTLSMTCKVGMDLCLSSPSLDNNKPLFLARGWRGQLCRCRNCLEFYAQKGIKYLVDKEDSMEEYENIAKQKRQENMKNMEDTALNLFENLDHVSKIEFLSGIADMRNEIRSFLGNRDSSSPITSAEIYQMFDNLSKKRQRTH